MRPSPVAVLAVVEAVVYGLVARHVYEDVLPAALFLVPMVVGYRTVGSDERRLGVLTPSAALLMMLGAGIAEGWAGVIFVMLLMPAFMLIALLGGALASLVRGIRHAAARLTGPRRPRAVRLAANPFRGAPRRARTGTASAPLPSRVRCGSRSSSTAHFDALQSGDENAASGARARRFGSYEPTKRTGLTRRRGEHGEKFSAPSASPREARYFSGLALDRIFSAILCG